MRYIPAHAPVRRLSVIRSFADRGTEDVYNGIDSRAARRACPNTLWTVVQRKLDYLDAAVSLASLRAPPADQLEALKRDQKGQHSIRINRQLRICFVWTADGPHHVTIVDYH